MMEDSGHVPVLFTEAIEGLHVQKDTWYVDATFGRGGHTQGILEQGGRVIAFDQDQTAIAYGQTHFVKEIETGRLVLVARNFEYIGEEVRKRDVEIAGILADFGVSSNQLDEGERGFSFQHDAPLDMRMSSELGVTAKDLVNALGKKELTQVFTEFAQEQQAYRIADAIVNERKNGPIETTRQLAVVIERKIGRHGHLHPATKTFMALRMLVNDELGVIERMLPQAFQALATGGRLVTISFHEGEDRIVKQFNRTMVDGGKAIAITKKPLMAGDEEIHRNIRSRSAKLRIIEKAL